MPEQLPMNSAVRAVMEVATLRSSLKFLFASDWAAMLTCL